MCSTVTVSFHLSVFSFITPSVCQLCLFTHLPVPPSSACLTWCFPFAHFTSIIEQQQLNWCVRWHHHEQPPENTFRPKKPMRMLFARSSVVPQISHTQCHEIHVCPWKHSPRVSVCLPCLLLETSQYRGPQMAGRTASPTLPTKVRLYKIHQGRYDLELALISITRLATVQF